jgi:hypothetical protein
VTTSSQRQPGAAPQETTEQTAREYQAEALEWFHARYKAVQTVLAGRPDTDLMFVSEILAALDPQTPSGVPLPVTWDGIVMGPSGDTDGERTLVPLTSSHGGPVALVLTDEQRLALGGLLLTSTHAGESCPVPGCGTDAVTLDDSDPTMWGWILVQVAGTEIPARWYCNPWCASAAITAAGAELTAADRAAAVDPDQQHPHDGQDADDVARCVRCGCTENAACESGCYWVPNRQMDDLCSACATDEELQAMAYTPAAETGEVSA